MAGRLHRAKATLEVRTPGGEQRLEGVSISVRQNVATVRLGSEVLLERAEVARVVPVPGVRGSWTLMFETPSAESDVWTVTDERRACCGRR